MAHPVRPVNTFLFFKLPAAWWCGVRLRSLSDTEAVTTVRLRWFNRNPFQSMFWAVQGMAAELASGVLVMQHIKASQHKISMLVLNNQGKFTKKATGRIRFTCTEGEAIRQAVLRAVETGEGQAIRVRSVGRNAAGEVVSWFEFEWTLKVRRDT